MKRCISEFIKHSLIRKRIYILILSLSIYSWLEGYREPASREQHRNYEHWNARIHSFCNSLGPTLKRTIWWERARFPRNFRNCLKCLISKIFSKPVTELLSFHFINDLFFMYKKVNKNVFAPGISNKKLLSYKLRTVFSYFWYGGAKIMHFIITEIYSGERGLYRVCLHSLNDFQKDIPW